MQGVNYKVASLSAETQQQRAVTDSWDRARTFVTLIFLQKSLPTGINSTFNLDKTAVSADN